MYDTTETESNNFFNLVEKGLGLNAWFNSSQGMTLFNWLLERDRLQSEYPLWAKDVELIWGIR